MSIRTTLPLFSLFLLGACSGTTGRGSASDENTSAVAQALGGYGDQDRDDQGNDSQRVLLISVDGMHQSDLDSYVANHPNSTLAKLTHSGSEYTNAATSNPSD